MIRKFSIKPSIALLIYVFVAFFPGFLCAHLLRIAAISNNLLNVVLGIGLLILPFSLLSLLLILLLKHGYENNVSITHRRKRLYLILAPSLLTIAIVAFIGFIENTFELYGIFSNEARLQTIYTGNSPAFGRQLIMAWIGAYFFGLSVLLFGFYFSFKRSRE